MESKKRTIPLLPLRGILVFPYMIIHLDVGREKSISALEEAMVDDRMIMLAAQKDAQNDNPEPDDIFTVGTVAEIKQLLKLPGGTIRVLVEGLHRAEIVGYSDMEPYYQVEIREFEEPQGKTAEVEALTRTAVNQFEQWVKLSKKIPPETLVSVVVVEEPGRLTDLIASHLSLKVEDKQALLDAIDVQERLEKLCEILGREMEILELEKKINVRVRKQMEKTQKEYYLREQLKAIQKELGDKDDRTAEVDEYRERMKEQEFPKDVLEKIQKEIERLEKMPPMVAESAVIRTYLDWLLALPWSKESEDRLDIDVAEGTLEEDHYGLEKVKERILEYLSIRKLTAQMKGPILCLVGPPGVGKTSLARSVARAMERKFVRVSLGGVRDEAEIRGHRRTYVGALPGRIVQGMRTAGSKNPVFLLDEIDKMSADFRGDPSSALLEVLDPEQNNTFSDHYVELPFDLSRVLWIVTANVMHNIPRPLLDRMEIINIPGYTEEEKVQIAKRYLVDKQIKDHGLTNKQIVFSEGTLQKVIREYTREAGVRGLERNIAAICRKVARQIVQNKKKSVRVTAQNLHTFLGTQKYRNRQAELEDQVGVSTGLAWTEVGGDVLATEVTVMKGKGTLLLTGQLGEVMRESAQAGFSYIRSRAAELGIEADFQEKTDIHIHLPEGAIPKDGPSAGITMATAVVSALTGRAVRSDLAMTGEITLRGRVLPVGGIKEKMLAAHRIGIKTILMPKENKRDLEELPANVKKAIEFILVEHMDEVLESALVKPNE
ncbi:endopeptidase La [Azotosporobacter soli]|uniref:endopeptidase La n=1 Tax=Azotosporobacter soli TaxID=3055040 RepID=UPI0031FE6E51